MRIRTAVVLLLTGWGYSALAGEPSNEQSKRIINAEKRPLLAIGCTSLDFMKEARR